MEFLLNKRNSIGVHDAVLLEDYQNEEVFIDNLEKRFAKDVLYTYIGPVLVSINPYKPLIVYNNNELTQYRAKYFFEVPPHIFAITDNAFRSLLHENKAQCILISGESGSGKTEASKLVLQYIAEINELKSNIVVSVKNKLLQSNPLLEAFGNAKTNRNDNSSRFGKFMDIQFNYQGYPIGGNLINYLLEKSRVIRQAKGERNFHIFYQLLKGASDDELKSLDLNRDTKLYAYLKHQDDISCIDDKSLYSTMRSALTILDFSAEEENCIFRIIAAILHLGNVTFIEKSGKPAKIKDTSVTNIVANLLNCDPIELTVALTKRTIETATETIKTVFNLETAIYARDALSKAIYERLFNWLVQRLNTSLQSEATLPHNVIGILDIYGFEVSEQNSFEQLCINFCNEKLQQLFIELTLKSEQDEYAREGIQWVNINYFDNKIICDLIEHKVKGLIAIIDEECLLPGDSNDITLLEKLTCELAKHKHFLSHKQADVKLQKIMGRDEFQIMHYAGTVTYNIHGFIKKNNDLLFRDLSKTMSGSKNPLIQAIFANEKTNTDHKKRPDTVMTQFKHSLNNLILNLMDKQPSYIRCIKPNDQKLPRVFNRNLVRHQVKYLGLMENLRVRRAGYAYRRLYTKFLQRYKCLCAETWPNFNGPPIEGVKLLINGLGFKDEDYTLGKTKVFIKYPRIIFETEDQFQRSKHLIVTVIQSRWRGFVQMRRFRKFRQNVILTQKIVRGFLARRRAKHRHQAVLTIRKFISGFITRHGPKTNINRSFMAITRKYWLLTLATNLPQTLLDRQWPQCPQICEEASELLKEIHRKHMAQQYRQSLSFDRREQLNMKLLAENLFSGKKRSYPNSISKWFIAKRISNKELPSKVKTLLNGDVIKYITTVLKYDRRGYKSRERLLVVSKDNLYLLEYTDGIKVKHCLPLTSIKLVVTSENDDVLIVRIPESLMKTNKGDLILQVPNLIEMITYTVQTVHNNIDFSIIDTKSIEHNLKDGKRGTIKIVSGNEPKIHRSKSGHLMIVASP